MAELESIMKAVCDTLTENNVSAAISQYPPESKRRYEIPVVTVGLKSGGTSAAGMYDYLGSKMKEGGDSSVEVFGKRMEMTLGLDIYAPKGEKHGAGACLKIFSEIAEACHTLPSGIKVSKFNCVEMGFDAVTNMFKCRTELEFTAFLYAERDEGTEFLDFVLKGVLNS